MNYLVVLDAQAGELEKILSGMKRMIAKEFDPARMNGHHVSPGDALYFMRKRVECALRVKATVVRVLIITNHIDKELSQSLKEMQPRLQLTEDQYNFWSAKQQILLVEFGSAHKIGVIQVTSNSLTDRSDWIAFEDLELITE